MGYVKFYNDRHKEKPTGDDNDDEQNIGDARLR